MDGNFKGDFTSDTFHHLKHFSRVLMQQGRVQLDADWNEQGDILTYYLRQLASAIIGPYGGPHGHNGFEITKKDDGDFSIGIGDYYVNGILVRNNGIDVDGIPVDGHDPYEDSLPLPLYTYLNQPYYAKPDELPFDDSQFYLVYLDVWEEQITFLEDSAIREVALGANQPDTATRAQIVWQVKLISKAKFDPEGKTSFTQIVNMQAEESVQITPQQIGTISNRLQEILQPANRGRLKARAKLTQDNTDACTIAPDSRYRGNENQLYRVEIHSGNLGHPGKLTDPPVTFKWSRDNGSVVFPILGTPRVVNTTTTVTTTVTIGNVGRDEALTITQGDWVEIVDRAYLLDRVAYPLLKVNKVDLSDPLNILVTLEGASALAIDIAKDSRKHINLVLRRWDQHPKVSKKDDEPDYFDSASGTVKLVEGKGESTNSVIAENWITLEDGVQIQFQKGDQQPNQYRTGDYWLIPARTVTGDVEWPLSRKDPSQHVALPPHGVEHHYAPLAIIHCTSGQIEGNIIDLRFVFTTLATPV